MKNIRLFTLMGLLYVEILSDGLNCIHSLSPPPYFQIQYLYGFPEMMQFIMKAIT